MFCVIFTIEYVATVEKNSVIVFEERFVQILKYYSTFLQNTATFYL